MMFADLDDDEDDDTEQNMPGKLPADLPEKFHRDWQGRRLPVMRQYQPPAL